MKKRSSGFDYGFAVVEYGMCKLGTWPLRTKNLLLFDVRWGFVTIMNLIVVMNMFAEIYMGYGDSSNTVESFVVLNASIHAICNCLLPKIHRKKLAENVNSAIEDWSCLSSEIYNEEDEESRGIMKRYARASRLIGIGQLILGLLACCLYFTSVLIVQIHQDDTTWNNSIDRPYIIPVKYTFGEVSPTEYRTIFFIQMSQALTILITQWGVDCFFFGIVLHLSGQLHVLRKRFLSIVNEGTSTTEQRRIYFNRFVNRHCRLIDLTDNLEDSFHLSIMIQLLMNAFLIALTGFRFIVCLKSHDNVEAGKSLLFMQFTIMQSFLYTCAADILEGQSEGIFYTLWQISWNDLPTPMIRNLYFVMMRSKKPLRISAGKFLYISRVTFLDIMKAAVSYISFLQITL